MSWASHRCAVSSSSSSLSSSSSNTLHLQIFLDGCFRSYFFSSYSTQNMNMMINLNLFISIWRMHTNVECWMYVFVYMERKMSTSFRDYLPLSFSVGCKNRNIKKPIQKRHIRRYTLSHRPLARLSIEMDFRYGEHCNRYIQWTHFKTDM